MPASGPYSHDIKQNASLSVQDKPKTQEEELKNPSFRYALVDLNTSVVEKMMQPSIDFISAQYNWPEPNQPEVVTVNVGDVISVTIYEARSGGLFIPTEAGVRPGNFVTLPSQTVDKSGFISIPYVGLVKAQGRSANAIGESISRGLRERAVEPQVVVSFVQRNGAEVSVLGEVQESVRYSLGFEGDKILDAIAEAQGPRIPGHEALVTLQRNGIEYTIPFDVLLQDPKKNVYLRTNDTIYIYREPRTFLVYGAAQSGNYPFEKRKVFLSEALATARGLTDGRADPAEIYIYRHENPDQVYKFADLKNTPAEHATDVPVIYRLNLRKPEGFFMAQKFEVRDDDIVYVANAESVEFTKFLNLVSSTANTSDAVNNTYFDGSL